MKKGKIKGLAKTEKKIIKIFIEENLIEKLKVAITELGHEPKKAKNDILKCAKQIAKKLAEKAKVNSVKPVIEPESNIKEEVKVPFIQDKTPVVKPARQRQVRPDSTSQKANPLSIADNVETSQPILD